MKEASKRRWVIPAAALALTLIVGSVAFAATGSDSTPTTTPDTSATTPTQGAAPTTGDSSKPWGGQRSDETLLTDDTLTKVQAAAVAEVGSDATVVRVETGADGNAAYEVHMVKADNTPVTVYVDESFAVVSVQEGKGARGDGVGGRGHGGPGGQRSDETALTGDTLAKVTEAALAEAGSDATVERAETDADGNATYEAHVTKADGTRVTVYVDDSFQVVSVEDQPACDPAQHQGYRAPNTGRTDTDPTDTGTTETDTTDTAAPAAAYTL